MPPAAAAVAMDGRSPMDSTQSQNPNSDFSFSFGAIPSADISDNRIPSSNSSSFEAATAAASSNVARAVSRARPRLVKLRRQHPRLKSVAASDAGSGFNPFRSDSASSTVSSSSGIGSNGFGLLNGDAKYVNFESKGFVFGADGYGNGNLSGLDTSLGLGERVGNVGFAFDAKQSGVESNSSEEMRVNGEKAGKSDVGDAGKVKLLYKTNPSIH